MKRQAGKPVYELHYLESGRQASNLRSSAPKALTSSSEALGFQTIAIFLPSSALFVQ